MKSLRTAFTAILVAISLHFQAQNTLFSAAKAGLNLREKPDGSSPVLAKIPYGEKMTQNDLGYYGNLKTENMDAYWIYVTYQGKKGYVADVYALSVAPPPVSEYPMEAFLKNLGREKCEVSKESPSDGDDYQKMIKVLLDNGISYKLHTFYESFVESFHLPGISMGQAFVLARLLYGETSVFKAVTTFPRKSGQLTAGDISVKVNVVADEIGVPTYIRMEWCDGGCYQLQIMEHFNEATIIMSGGV